MSEEIGYAERLAIPLKPTRYMFGLIEEQERGVDKTAATMHIDIHTDKSGKILTLDIRLFDTDGWPADSKIVTMQVPNVR